ncbi:MAG TPA: hypothetical protein H9703_01885 [Candidatus Faecalibacterium faecigallinarum]|uniref:Lipoprotein n=1 Tax=Candidatus Faecalibacterium faecigallinarum TaxID=2838577 RepID=A0A9D2P657_9FIRM|nr:hypothetical protein [Candidatus Faecalibacterium faecigallinarum]
MKLKKIASLMLAGVMAVSMLTACGGNTTDDTQKPEEPDVTPSTSASAQTLVSNMSKEAQNKVTAVSNGDLDAALKSAVEDYFSNADVVKYGKIFEIPRTEYGWTDADARDTDIGEALVSNLGAYDDVIGNLNKLDNDKVSAYTAVEVYGVNGSVTDKDVLEQLGHKINQSVVNLKDEGTYTVNDSEHVTQYVDYDYEVSVSIVNANGRVWGIDDTVKFVAVAVTRTGTVETGMNNYI